MLCAWVLGELKKDNSAPHSLSYLAYATFLLGGVLKIPALSQSLSMDPMPAMNQFIPIAQRMRVCDNEGAFLTKKISIFETVSALMTHPEITLAPNFMKALSLIQLAILEILPQLLKQMENKISLKGFDTELKQYYSHLSRIFIPNLLNILNIFRQHEPKKYLMILGQMSKFILQFPVDLFPQVEVFIHNVTRNCITNLKNIPLKEILEIIKLNNFVEIRYKRKFLLDSEKVMIINVLAAKKHLLDLSEIEMLMHVQFTLFENFKEQFSEFKDNFKALVANKKLGFSKQIGDHFCEMDLYNCILYNLPDQYKPNLRLSVICTDTGKQIDIVFILGNVKIAIHIDGRIFHYYLDRDEIDRDTLLRNRALQNAGWINICQKLSDKIDKQNIEIVKKDLLEKLKLLIPLKGSPQKKSSGTPTLVETLNHAIHHDITASQIAPLLSLGLPSLVDAPISGGLRKRFVALQQQLNPIFPFTQGIATLISQYELLHPQQGEFAAILISRDKVLSFTNEFMVSPYTSLLFSRENIKQSNAILICFNDPLSEKTEPSAQANKGLATKSFK